MSGFQSFQPCPDQAKDFSPLVNDTPVSNETIGDNVTYLKTLHHALYYEDMPPCSILKEEFVRKNTTHYLEGLSLPPFLSKMRM